MALASPGVAAAAKAANAATAKAVLSVDPGFLASFPDGPPPIPTLVCRYNPSDLSISGGSQWSKEETGEDDAPNMHFVKPQGRTLKVSLVFDQFGLPSGDVSRELKALSDWTTPRRSTKGDRLSAPWLRFQWGTTSYFLCVLENYSISYSLFAKSGAPLRAKVDVSLKEKKDTIPMQNPTSGGVGGERFHVTSAGDTLHSLAHRYYGSPALWRGLAAFNDIDDPLRVATGLAIALPAHAVLEELS